MMIITQKAIPRRTILKGVGATLALPFLDAMVPALARAQSVKAPNRLSVVYVPNGIMMNDWTPEKEGADYQFKRILEGGERPKLGVDMWGLISEVRCPILSMRGARGLLESVWLVHERLNPQLNLLGVLATMYKKDSEHTREVVAELRAVFENKVFETVIEDEDAVAKAPVAHKSVLAYRPDSTAAAAFRQLAKEIAHA